MNRNSIKLIKEKVKTNSHRQFVNKSKMNRGQKSNDKKDSKNDISTFKLKVYSPAQIHNLESIAKAVTIEPIALHISDEHHQITPSLKVYSLEQVRNLERIATGDFESEVIAETVSRKRKTPRIIAKRR